jgi:pilus assembly protein CpaB
MNRRLVSVFAFALLVATLTSFLVYRLVLLRLQAPGRAVPSNKLVVAAHDLQVGALIHDYDLTETPWSGPIPEHVAKTRQEAIGRGVIATIYENEPLLNHRLAPRAAGAGLAATIPVGMRAVALRVNDVVGLAGFVLPGMRVDVLIAGTAPGTNQSWTGTLCRTVLQNIEVLSTGTKIEQNVEGKPETAQVVNLLVTPDQAEVLNLASTETKVQLVLRNPLDTHEQTTHGTSVASLFGQPGRPTPEPVLFKLPAPQPVIVPHIVHDPPGVATIEVFSGTRKSEEVFEAPQEKSK